MGERKKIISALILVATVLCGMLYAFFIKSDKADEQAFITDVQQEIQVIEINETTQGTEGTRKIYIQLGGAVNNEGVYAVEEGQRVFEVVALAGGLSDLADPNAVNQARKVVDGEFIYFPTYDEVNEGLYKSEANMSQESTLVNINTATMEELMSLPGIGESKAKAIINYRTTNGPFKSIEEIMNVNGIKDAMFDKIKDFITI